MQTHQFWVEAQWFETRSPSTSLTSTSAAAVSAPNKSPVFFGESPQGQVGSVVILSVALGIYL